MSCTITGCSNAVCATPALQHSSALRTCWCRLHELCSVGVAGLCTPGAALLSGDGESQTERVLASFCLQVDMEGGDKKSVRVRKVRLRLWESSPVHCMCLLHNVWAAVRTEPGIVLLVLLLLSMDGSQRSPCLPFFVAVLTVLPSPPAGPADQELGGQPRPLPLRPVGRGQGPVPG